jgi:hypothetical protein
MANLETPCNGIETMNALTLAMHRCAFGGGYLIRNMGLLHPHPARLPKHGPGAARRTPSARLCTILTVLGLLQIPLVNAGPIEHVIHISMDGLRPDAITALGPANLPNFYRMRTEGAFTDNARSDYDYTVTLPVHTTELTGRGVLGENGHQWTSNGDPDEGETLASNKGSYIAGIFDVVHDYGLRTGEYAGKTKFSLFATSWDAFHGALDLTGTDNGRNKIDTYVYMSDSADLVNALVANMATQPINYTFIHFADPDAIGHQSGWDPTPGSPYSDAVRAMDDRLGVILSLVATNAELAGRTAIVLTADHGGYLKDHSDSTLPQDYTVPFYVWGPGVMPGAPLYTINPASRLDPGTNRPPYSDPVQPIRNGEAANVCLKLLGLPPVPGSTIGTAQDLVLTVLPPSDFCRLKTGSGPMLMFSTTANVLYDVQTRDDFRVGPWADLVTNLVGTGSVVTNLDTAGANLPQRFYRLRVHF